MSLPSVTKTERDSPPKWYISRLSVIFSNSSEICLPNSSRLPKPAMAMMLSRSVMTAVKSVLRLSVSQNRAANSSRPHFEEVYTASLSPEEGTMLLLKSKKESCSPLMLIVFICVSLPTVTTSYFLNFLSKKLLTPQSVSAIVTV